MSNAERTKAFFKLTDSETKDAILDNIANHYGISRREALEDVADEDAEALLDYVTGPTRSAAYVVMRRHGL